MAQPGPYFGDIASAAMAISTPMSLPVLSSPILGIGNIGRFDATGNFTRYDIEEQLGNMDQQGTPLFTRQQSGRRESFGSVFPGSSGTGGNGNGNSQHVGMTGGTQYTMPS